MWMLRQLQPNTSKATTTSVVLLCALAFLSLLPRGGLRSPRLGERTRSKPRGSLYKVYAKLNQPVIFFHPATKSESFDCLESNIQKTYERMNLFVWDTLYSARSVDGKPRDWTVCLMRSHFLRPEIKKSDCMLQRRIKVTVASSFWKSCQRFLFWLHWFSVGFTKDAEVMKCSSCAVASIGFSFYWRSFLLDGLQLLQQKGIILQKSSFLRHSRMLREFLHYLCKNY